MNEELSRALQTLFYPFHTGALQPPRDSTGLFLNAAVHEDLKYFSKEGLFCQQYFKPYAAALVQQGYHSSPDIPAGYAADFTLILLPKNQIEAEHLIATGLKTLKVGGLLIAAADNKAGGARLEKLFQKFGLTRVQHLSKHKARVVWGYKGATAPEIIEHAYEAGQPRPVLQSAFTSWPGIFGWDKIDLGSKILLQHLPETLYGAAADFGCGYGFLSRALVQQNNITALTCIDADIRALRMCERNLSQENCSKKPVTFLWEDLRTPIKSLKNLDLIVMNPPFHEGKSVTQSLGAAFITTAAQTLRPGGTLWMVANTHLAYEPVLQTHFKTGQKIFEGQGFKVFCAVK